ncbi:MAG TPA: ABC transporter permease [Candidatus Saccharimonadia bacterium]|nr:ABC transporter permease [Candidatus Saccharimonadia bacterium]
MNLRRENLRLAYRNLQAARARSFLTMLGIVIGVVAVVLVVCIGQGVKQQISGDLGRYGKSLFVAQPEQVQADGGVFAGLASASSNLLSSQDLRTVQKTAGVVRAAPLSTASGSMTGDNTVESPFIIATTPDFSDIIKQHMISGGFFESSDNGKAVVLGMDVAGKLFNNTAAVGQTLAWRGQQFIVAGVYDDFKAPPLSLESNFNNAVFIPYDVASKLMGNPLGIYQILGKAESSRTTVSTITATTIALRAAHGGSRDVSVVPAAAAGSASDRTIHLLTLLVSGAAIIALVVGGVGIMDVMLVSVTERMYEIGLRKAIGATNHQIMRQFVVEAFLLSAWGALIGVALSCAAVGLLRMYTSMQPVLVWQILVIAPLLAMAVGIFFGSMPALKAARKDPIEALRHD